MKKIEDLKEGDHIAFGFNYNGGIPTEIIVDNITCKHGEEFLVHFAYGHHSLSEYVKPENILAIGNLEKGESELNGWSGKYDILQPDNQLIINSIK